MREIIYFNLIVSNYEFSGYLAVIAKVDLAAIEKKHIFSLLGQFAYH